LLCIDGRAQFSIGFVLVTFAKCVATNGARNLHPQTAGRSTVKEWSEHGSYSVLSRSEVAVESLRQRDLGGRDLKLFRRARRYYYKNRQISRPIALLYTQANKKIETSACKTVIVIAYIVSRLRDL